MRIGIPTIALQDLHVVPEPVLLRETEGDMGDCTQIVFRILLDIEVSLPAKTICLDDQLCEVIVHIIDPDKPVVDDSLLIQDEFQLVHRNRIFPDAGGEE